MFALLETPEARRFFIRHRQELKSAGVHVDGAHIRIKIIKNNHDPKTLSFVAFYDIISSNKKVRLVGLARPNNNSWHEYLTLRYIATHKKLNINIPKPYLVDKNRNFLLTSYAKGSSLVQTINKYGTIPPQLLKKIILVLHNFEKLSKRDLFFLRNNNLFWLERDLDLAKKKYGFRVKPAIDAWLVWKKSWPDIARKNFYFAHGDMNPKNIYVDCEQLTLIDFDRATLAPRYWDLAGLLSQIESYPKLNISNRQRLKIKNDILVAWNKNVKPLSAKELENIKMIENYYRIAAITNLLVWGDPYNDKQRIKWLIKRL
ncbi:MAG: hypothetical protein A3A80_01570 [Candidatus Terrybacteria bacterium RIFCSPLOWO2_01_FULL_44_24]|uniref:Aminoglycoside phosphotransferase domain-containing protein n=1 Tax=Candidatus Terrybacteria bacterium RIFCSPHIGHO2_01_FULL_43_35 TaxID=1802361 RepID=A0A1G2PHK2_9BACT|nr:MAG: hypothetical protein A2828_03945 [Candidatus Terrybacteria bacterium RIFCSPHIGHO2_01_FULL_43_35]OHA49913.1 MAG: hypothetical protein A3B75_03355 [Candidatus Terrybacteria bacterium RIFCSPHIGHO2_02_FULL_43_14]OHA51766.1 MAG: hypothetical protein A3A80_01570 [Candidatus Terrybacteria bacterium RIFCSPLOWO2_01_FULL_44_24]